MAKKQPKEPQRTDLASDPVIPKSGPLGRPPKTLNGLQACLADLIEKCKAWEDRFEKVWFSSILPLEDGHESAFLPKSPEWYQCAIDHMLDIANLAALGKEKLEKGKAKAEKGLERMKQARDNPQEASEEPHDPEPEDDWAEKFKKDLDL